MSITDSTDSSDAATQASSREPRADKVAKVAEIKAKIDDSDAVFVSEYRGLTVAQLADLRNQLRKTDSEHIVLKNSLVKRAFDASGLEGLDEYLVGPNAITFVHGDVAAAAKALKDASKTYPQLVLKAGLLGGNVLTEADVMALADLPSREELLARLAGGLQAPLNKTARLLQALPAKFGYGLAALIQKQEAA